MTVFEQSQMLMHATPGGATTKPSAILSPVLTQTIFLFSSLHSLLSYASFFVLLRLYILSLHTINFSRFVLLYVSKALAVFSIHAFYLSRVVLANTSLASRLLLIHLLAVTIFLVRLSSQGVGKVWKMFEPLRQKLFFELMVFILGGGNQIFLLILWPGWWIVGAVCGITWLLFCWARWKMRAIEGHGWVCAIIAVIQLKMLTVR